MNIFDLFQSRIAALLQAMQAEGRLPKELDLNRFNVEPPRQASYGDLACNAAMAYARELKGHFVDPRQFASELGYSLSQMSEVDQVEVAGPGFLNIRLHAFVYYGLLREGLLLGGDFGKSTSLADSGKINVEYVSANPTGPMHVGHARGAVFGDALANLLAFNGGDVTREYYINDAGVQINVLARSAYFRYREALGESVTIPEGLYPGDYLKNVGRLLAEEFGENLLEKPEEQVLPLIRPVVIAQMMAMIRDDLAALNIKQEVFFSEQSLFAPLTEFGGKNAVEQAIATLESKGLIYQGRLAPPKGAVIEDWEDREQTLFKASEFGDDVDRPLLKSDDSFTYFANDIAYHKDKLDRGFTELIDVWGADHGGYVKRMEAAVRALSDGKAHLDVKLCQLVKLMRQGEPIKMSKRAGDFITLREVVDEVGVDAMRFMMLFRKNDAPLDFDLSKVVEQSKDNPVFYVQYAHARGSSILRQAKVAFPDINLSAEHLRTSVNFLLLSHESELDLLRSIALYPRLIDQAARAHEPHRVAFYLYDLAQKFHMQWNLGKDSPQLRFINEKEQELSIARLSLVIFLTNVLASGLTLLGVTAPKEMR